MIMEGDRYIYMILPDLALQIFRNNPKPQLQFGSFWQPQAAACLSSPLYPRLLSFQVPNAPESRRPPWTPLVPIGDGRNTWSPLFYMLSHSGTRLSVVLPQRC